MKQITVAGLVIAMLGLITSNSVWARDEGGHGGGFGGNGRHYGRGLRLLWFVLLFSLCLSASRTSTPNQLLVLLPRPGGLLSRRRRMSRWLAAGGTSTE